MKTTKRSEFDQMRDALYALWLQVNCLMKQIPAFDKVKLEADMKELDSFIQTQKGK